MKYTPRAHQQAMLDAMAAATKGIVQCPTGGGKTFTIITNAKQYLQPAKVVVVVAPQLLLSEQLFNEFDYHLQDVDFIWRQVSSEGKSFQRDRKGLTFRPIPPASPTTIVEEIVESYDHAVRVGKPLILFTTYKSLGRIADAGIPVEVAYYDEAHNCTASDNFQAVKAMAEVAKRQYFFTATPRTGFGEVSMTNEAIYGELICTVDFNELVKLGVIVKPVLRLVQSNASTKGGAELDLNVKTMKEVIEHSELKTAAPKLLFCTQGTKAIGDILDSKFVAWAQAKGYKVLAIDSKNQGYVDGQRGLNKGKFLTQLNALGAIADQKLIFMHYSMLGEGIDVKAFTDVVFLRKSMGDVFATQSIGRVIRASEGKTHGNVIVVQHADDTDSVRSLISDIVRSLIEAGVPLESILNEEDGRAEEEEVVEALPEDITKAIKEVAAQYQWSNMLAELLGCDDEELAF